MQIGLHQEIRELQRTVSIAGGWGWQAEWRAETDTSTHWLALVAQGGGQVSHEVEQDQGGQTRQLNSKTLSPEVGGQVYGETQTHRKDPKKFGHLDSGSPSKELDPTG